MTNATLTLIAACCVVVWPLIGLGVLRGCVALDKQYYEKEREPPGLIEALVLIALWPVVFVLVLVVCFVRGWRGGG